MYFNIGKKNAAIHNAEAFSDSERGTEQPLFATCHNVVF